MAAVAWLLLIIAGFRETGRAIGLKHTEGRTRLWPSLLTIALMAGSFFPLSKAPEDLPVGTAYAVWTGGRWGRSLAASCSLANPAIPHGCSASS